MINKQVDYLTAVDMPSDYYIFYRRTSGSKGLSFHSWNSKTSVWSPSEKACGAFMGLDVFADPIEEKEVLRIIEQFT